MTTPRIPAADRKAQIVAAGLHLAQKHGWERVTREMVVRRLQISHSLVTRYFTAEAFRDAMMTGAVEARDLRVVGQGLAAEHPIALAAPRRLRWAALARLRALTLVLLAALPVCRGTPYVCTDAKGEVHICCERRAVT